MNRWRTVLLVCSTALFLPACAGPTIPTPAGGESPLHLFANPAIGSVLARGRSVQTTLAVLSTLDAPGRLTLSIQDQFRASLLVPEPSSDIPARGEARFQAAFVVPSDASSIQLVFRFQPTSAKVRPMVVEFSFPVE